MHCDTLSTPWATDDTPAMAKRTTRPCPEAPRGVHESRQVAVAGEEGNT